jgi:site-specific DNA-methyltransferase (adenine-specific)
MSVETEVAPNSSLARQALEIGKIHQGDCLQLMRQIEGGTIDLVFADPPFNIGYEYDQYHDEQADHEYIDWSRQWMEEVHRVLKPGGTFWLAIGDEYAAELKVDAEHKIGFSTRSWVVWYYTFGVNCKYKFSRSHVHLFHFVKDEANFTFNAEDQLVRVPSARALVYGDKRANPAGRLPDDTWILRPQDLPEGFQPTDDTWYFARVAGTFKERQGFHGCQMPEQLLGRIIRTSSNAGDIVLDPFAGSGTTLAVAKKLGRQLVGCELSEEYVRAATERLAAIDDGTVLDGAADPIASAPTTANGRRLESFVEQNKETGRQGDKENAASETPPLPISPSPTTPLTKRDLRTVVRDAIVD